jgi:hypothetical protein
MKVGNEHSKVDVAFIDDNFLKDFSKQQQSDKKLLSSPNSDNIFPKKNFKKFPGFLINIFVKN